MAAELEQLGAPSGVVFPDMMVGGFICLAICILKYNKPQFWQKKQHITIPPIIGSGNSGVLPNSVIVDIYFNLFLGYKILLHFV